MASQPYVDIMFGPLLPDFGGAPNPEIPGYLVDALNVRYTPNGYRGMPTFSNVASATAIGSTGISSALGACYYGATTTNFFVATNNGAMFESRDEGIDTWQDVSPATGTLDDKGDFMRFGLDIVYVCESRAPVVKSLGSSHATVFASLGGSPPTVATGARVRNHAVFGGGVSNLYSIRTSAIGDHTDWPTPGSADARAKEAIQEDLNPEFGFVRRIVGGEKIGLIFQDSAITRMTYIGGSAVYEFDTFERIDGQGTRLYSRPTSDGTLWYFYTDSGLYATDGYSVKSVSDGKVDESLFQNTISDPYGSSLTRSFTSAFDQARGNIIYGGNANGGTARYQLVYNTQSGFLSLTNEANQVAVFNGYDEIGSGLRRPYVYNINYSDRKLQRLNGATGTIGMQTGFIEIEPGWRVQIHGAHLLGTGVPGSLTLSYKAESDYDNLSAVQSGFTAMTAASRGNKATARADAQFFSFRVAGTGAETQLIRGIRVYYEKTAPAT